MNVKESQFAAESFKAEKNAVEALGKQVKLLS
jgi:hypothetical protein